MRDWKVTEKKPTIALDVPAKSVLRVEMEKLVEGQPNQLGCLEKAEKVANLLVLRAIDTALRWGVNKTLVAFRLEVKLRPLLSGQVRKFVAVEELSESQRRPGATHRAFLQVPGEEWAEEIPDSMLEVDVIHVRTDQGSVGWAAYQYLFLEMPINGTFSYDPPHHVHNEAWWRNFVRVCLPTGRGQRGNGGSS